MDACLRVRKMIFHDLISSVLNEREPFHNIWFAGDFHTPPEFSYQVNFPRLELVLSGEYINEMESHDRKVTHIVAKLVMRYLFRQTAGINLTGTQIARY